MRTESTNSGRKLKEPGSLKHKRRFCKVEGCCRIVKSQGVCQRHGAKSAKCKVVGCTKQAQGSHRGMCKAHAREARRNQPGDDFSSHYRQLLRQHATEDEKKCPPRKARQGASTVPESFPRGFQQMEYLALSSFDGEVALAPRTGGGSTHPSLAAHSPREVGTRFKSIVLGNTYTNPNTTLVLDYYDHGSMPASSGQQPLSQQGGLLL